MHDVRRTGPRITVDHSTGYRPGRSVRPIRPYLGGVFRELRQPRYAGLAAGALILAVGCVGAGTWQIFRYQHTAHANHQLRANAHAAAVPLTTTLVPLTGHGAAPARDAIRFRTVTVTGSYLPVAPQYLRGDSINGVDGYDVIAPLRTDAGVLLVIRGFAAGNSGASPAVAPPPRGTTDLVGRLDGASTAADGAGELAGRQLETINPAEQARRLGTPVYQGVLTLDAGRAGTAGLTALPGPDLSNPAGGAYEAQHLAYVVQWYLFALLALAAPFAFRRHEVREAQRQYLGIDPGAIEIDQPLPAAPDLLRPALTSGAHEDGTVTTALARRSGAELRRYRPVDPDRVRRARRLADRYGRSLGAEFDGPVEAEPAHRRPASAARDDRPLTRTHKPDSTVTVHSSEGDELHGAYNDYLWELALRDGNLPDLTLPDPVDPADDDQSPRPPAIPDGPATIDRD